MPSDHLSHSKCEHLHASSKCTTGSEWPATAWFLSLALIDCHLALALRSGWLNFQPGSWRCECMKWSELMWENIWGSLFSDMNDSPPIDICLVSFLCDTTWQSQLSTCMLEFLNCKFLFLFRSLALITVEHTVECAWSVMLQAEGYLESFSILSSGASREQMQREASLCDP